MRLRDCEKLLDSRHGGAGRVVARGPPSYCRSRGAVVVMEEVVVLSAERAGVVMVVVLKGAEGS